MVAIVQLPVEVLELMLQYLPVRSLGRVSQVCRLFNSCTYSTPCFHRDTVAFDGIILTSRNTHDVSTAVSWPYIDLTRFHSVVLLSTELTTARIARAQPRVLLLPRLSHATRLSGQHIIRMLAKCTVQELSTARGHLSDEDYRAICDTNVLTKAVKLDVSTNALTSKAFAQGGWSNCNLRRLDVSSNPLCDPITKCEPEQLQGLCDLISMSLNLEELDISKTALGDAGGVAIATAASKCPCLQSINMSFNGFHDEAGAALATALQKQSALQRLQVWCHICDRHLTCLKVQNNQLGASSGIAFGRCLSGMSSLTSLDLGHNALGPEGVKGLADGLRDNTTLIRLDISFNGVRDEGVAVLAELLAVNSTLQYLNLCSNNILEAGAKALGNALRVNGGLRHLKLTSNRIGDLGAQGLSLGLACATMLKTLDLVHNQIGPAGCKALCSALANNCSVNRLELSDNPLMCEGYAAFEDLLAGHQTLCYLNAGGTYLGEEAAAVIGRGLARNTSVSYLCVPCNRMGPQGMNTLVTQLSTNENSKLSALKVSQNNIGPSGAAVLEIPLANNLLRVTHLDLSGNNIQTAGCDAIFRGLVGNNTLRQLILRNNLIDAAAAAQIGTTLISNTTLVCLDLQRNRLADAGMPALAAGLAGNEALKLLGLADNMISDYGANTLAFTLKSSTGGLRLDLSQNDVDLPAFQVLDERSIHEWASICRFGKF